MTKKDYIRPNSAEEFYAMISTTRGIKQTWLVKFSEAYEKATPDMLEFICTAKPFGIGTFLSIVRLGKKKQKKFLQWYLTGKPVLDLATDTVKYNTYPVKDVHSWVANKTKKDK